MSEKYPKARSEGIALVQQTKVQSFQPFPEQFSICENKLQLCSCDLPDYIN